MNLNTIIAPEIIEAIRIFVLVVGVLHLIISLILFKNILSAARMVETPRSKLVRSISIVHIFLVLCILLAIIFYNQL